MFKNILVAVDGSEHALKAAEVAGDLARNLKANLRMITIYDPIPNYLGEPNLQNIIDQRLEQAERIISEAQQRVGSVPGEFVTEKLEGPVAEAVLAVISALSIDLVVMGTRGLGRLGQLLIGSQSQKVVANAPCPVLLVR